MIEFAVYMAFAIIVIVVIIAVVNFRESRPGAPFWCRVGHHRDCRIQREGLAAFVVCNRCGAVTDVRISQ